jgi:hypothetical protein
MSYETYNVIDCDGQIVESVIGTPEHGCKKIAGRIL